MTTSEPTTPSAVVWASVRYAAAPSLAPDDLLAFVVPHERDGRIEDWVLTDDVVAFGEVDVPARYQEWRSTWVRSWALDPTSSLARLAGLARTLPLARPVDFDLVESAVVGPFEEDRTLATEVLPRLADGMEVIRDAVTESQRSGFGFVDATPGRQRTGLARAWSGFGGPELLAADQSLRVTMDPDVGMCVQGSDGLVLRGVDEISMGESTVELRAGEERRQLGVDRATPLGWVVPGSTRWRVRAVPEVIVWAKTFGGLVEAARSAAASGLVVRLHAAP